MGRDYGNCNRNKYFFTSWEFNEIYFSQAFFFILFLSFFLFFSFFLFSLFIFPLLSFFPVHVACKSNYSWGNGKESDWVCWINCIQGLRWDSEKGTNYCWTVADFMKSSGLWGKEGWTQNKAHSFIDFTCGMCMSFTHIHYALVFASMYALSLLHMILTPKVLYLLWVCCCLRRDVEASASHVLSNFRKYRSAPPFYYSFIFKLRVRKSLVFEINMNWTVKMAHFQVKLISH